MRTIVRYQALYVLMLTASLSTAHAASQALTVNVTTAEDQFEPVMAQTTDGSFFVAWTSEDQDGDGLGIFGRKLDPDGIPMGTEVALNTTTTGNQRNPAIATLSDGRFIVVWQSANDAEIHGRFVNANGTANGNDIVLSTLAPWIEPIIVADGLGGFALAWSTTSHIYFQAFDNTGTPRDSATIIADAPIIPANDFDTYGAIAVVALDNGQYFVAWESNRRVLVQRLDSDGTPLAQAFRINTDPVDQRNPSVLPIPGAVLVTWGEDNAVRVQNLRHDNIFVGPTAIIATGDYSEPSLLPTTNGYLLAFPQYAPHAEAQIQAQNLDVNGAPVGESYRLSLAHFMPILTFNWLTTDFGFSKLGKTLNNAPVVLWFSGTPGDRDVVVRTVPDFVLSGPFFETACTDEASTATIQVAALPGVGALTGGDAVTLEVPAQAGFSFSPNPVVPSGNTTLTGPVLTEGIHDFQIRGRTDSNSEDITTFSFRSYPGNPHHNPVPMNTPANAPIAPVVSWWLDDIDFGPSYFFRVQIARDMEFNKLVDEGTVPSSAGHYTTSGERFQYRGPILRPNAQYYWRVRTENVCGVNPWSTVMTFITAPDILISRGSLSIGFSQDIIGSPGVSALPAPGTFMVAYPSQDYYFDSIDDLAYTHTDLKLEKIGPPGSPSVHAQPIGFPELNLNHNQEDVDTPMASTMPDDSFRVVWGGREDVISRRVSTYGGSFDSLEYVGEVSDHPSHPALATNQDNGDQLIVWSDQAQTRIAGRMLASDGTVLTEAFTVNTAGAPQGDHPAVAWSPSSNDFLVVWESDLEIVARRVASDGTPAGSQFQVNSIQTETQRRPAITHTSHDDLFFVLWESNSSADSDPSGWSIQGRAVTLTEPTGSDFQINSVTTGHQQEPAIAYDPNWGGLLATWQSQVSAGNDNDGWSIQARYFSANLTPTAGEFQVNQLVDGDQLDPAIAANAASQEFMIVWRDSSDRILAALIEAIDYLFIDGFESGNTSGWSGTVE